MKKLLLMISVFFTISLHAAIKLDYMMHVVKKNQSHIIKQTVEFDSNNPASVCHENRTSIVTVDLRAVSDQSADFVFIYKEKQSDGSLHTVVQEEIIAPFNQEGQFVLPVGENDFVQQCLLFFYVTDTEQ